ncbi:heterokaryon incompatibility protein-domain-containing protein [Phyllosticta capitalensis]|uniref:heterokaryon incompatibility protein-domain-containing protein n=1 Tax=Phyllosticta capitalensis TaxID=121624 RepID=UPI00312D8626
MESTTKSPTSNSNTSVTSDSLCRQCSQLNISLAKFQVTSGEPLPGLENYDNAGLGRRSLGFLDEIYRKSTACPFCRLIFCATYRDGEDSEVNRGSVGYDGLDSLEERVECLVEWQLDGREISGSSNISTPKTRRLRVFNMKTTFPEAHIVLVEGDAQEGPTFLGRIVSAPQIDTGLIRRWMHLCESKHGPGCRHPQTRVISGKELIFVDVQDMCLVWQSSTCRYMTLSYVWGGIAENRLLHENYAALFRRGSLSKLKPARTITAAMELCKTLGERFIWIDRLCIVQDDASNWEEIASIMDVIFSNSVLTICAAFGNGVKAGLPGFASQPRHVEQHIQKVAGMDLMVVRPPEGYISGSIWDKRSWVFQERLLSRRLVLFAGQRVFFQCRQATWSEEIHAESSRLIWTLDMIDGPLTSERSNPVRHFTKCVQLYSLRTLTYECDKLYAFEGITKSLERPLGTTFLYGLPTGYFDWALLWEPVSPAHRIRVAEDRGFPSWSWCGWMVGVEWRLSAVSGCVYNLHDWLVNHTWIEWFVVQQDKTLRHVWSHDSDTPSAEGSDSDSISGRWAGYGKETGRRRRGLPGHTPWPYPVPTEEDVTSAVSENKEIIRPGSLCFFTYSAFFTLSRKSMSSATFATDLQPGLQRLGILDNKGDWCGTIVLEESWMSKIGQPLEFLAISEARDFSLEEFDSWTYYIPQRREQSEWEVFFALLVRKTETGAYERVGLAKIFQHAFYVNSFGPGLVWKQVVLG